MNRTGAYARPGELRTKTVRMLEKRGGRTHPVNRKNTSSRCTGCFYAYKESRDGEDYDCIMLWRHRHSDTNAAKNILLICLHGEEETGGRVH